MQLTDLPAAPYIQLTHSSWTLNPTKTEAATVPGKCFPSKSRDSSAEELPMRSTSTHTKAYKQAQLMP